MSVHMYIRTLPETVGFFCKRCPLSTYTLMYPLVFIRVCNLFPIFFALWWGVFKLCPNSYILKLMFIDHRNCQKVLQSLVNEKVVSQQIENFRALLTKLFYCSIPVTLGANATHTDILRSSLPDCLRCVYSTGCSYQPYRNRVNHEGGLAWPQYRLLVTLMHAPEADYWWCLLSRSTWSYFKNTTLPCSVSITSPSFSMIRCEHSPLLYDSAVNTPSPLSYDQLWTPSSFFL